MNWSAIIALLVQTFGPVLVEWLKKWLEDKLSAAAARVPGPETFATPAAGMSALFDEATVELPRLAFARRTLLRRLKSAAVARSGMVFAGAVVPALTADERAEIRDAAGAAENE